MSDCLFCKIRDGEVPGDRVYEDDDVMAFHDIHPQAPIHILIIPKKHISTVNDVEDADALVMGKLFLAAKKIAMQEGLADEGYRLVVNTNKHAGQIVFHIHMHLLAGRQLTGPLG